VEDKTTLSFALKYGIENEKHHYSVRHTSSIGTKIREEKMKRHVAGMSAARIVVWMSGVVTHA